MNVSEALTYEILLFDPRTASAELWALYHAFRRIRHAESSPEDPLLPDDITERLMKRVDPFEEDERYLLLVDGRVAGQLSTDWYRPNAPGYDSNAKYLWAFLAVEQPARHRGYGTALSHRLLAVAERQGKDVINTWAEEDDGYGFLAHLGATQVSTGADNRLDLWAVDWEMVDDWVREGEARNPSTRLVLYEHRIPDADLEAFSPMFGALLNTMPFDDMEHGEIVVTAEMMRDQYERFAEMDASHHAFVAYEPDGSIAGMTDVSYLPAQPDRINQRFTGVRPDCRGRGLGKWVKAAMLQYLRRTYPEARWVITGNADSNDPMLAINRKLGFKTHKGRKSYQIHRDALAARLAER